MAPLRCAATFDPFLSLDCARVEGGGRNASGNLALDRAHLTRARHKVHIVHMGKIFDGIPEDS